MSVNWCSAVDEYAVARCRTSASAGLSCQQRVGCGQIADDSTWRLAARSGRSRPPRIRRIADTPLTIAATRGR